MKVGFIRYMQTEDFCPGSVDFKTVAKKKALSQELKKI